MPNDNQEKIESEPKGFSYSSKLLLYFLLFIFFTIVVIFYKDYSYAPSTENNENRCNSNDELQKREISSGEDKITAEVVESDSDKARGLSGRNCISSDRGMLFLYSTASSDRCFWMKDMNFSIDMIWLDDNGRVVTIHNEVAPDTYPKSFCPSEEATHVLEVSAGSARRLGWSVGTELSF